MSNPVVGQRTPLVVALDARSEAPPDAALLGGKGAALARLTRQGLPVPRGLVVTTEAWRRALRAHAEGVTDPALLRRRLLEAPLERELRAAVAAQLEAVGGDRWAVRSSAHGEDGAQQSFAGQQATRLGVRGLDAVLEAIRAVWSSLFSPEALLYRSRMSLEMAPPSIAVVVQRMVAAERAGVCFTANPVNAATHELIISASWGLGEGVVSGQASDTWYLRRGDGRVLRQDIATKEARVRLDEAGGTRREALGEDEASRPSLSGADLDRVTRLALQVEGLAGAPQDVEWAFDADGGLWLLQSRPITGPQRAAGAPGDVSCWTNANVGEALPGVGTPMTWSILRSFSRQGFEAAFGALGLDVPAEYELVGSFYGRVYLNLSQFASVITQIPLMEPATLLRLAGGPDVDQIEGRYERRSARSFLLRLPLTVPRIAASHLTMPLLGRRWAAKVRRERDALFARDLGRLDERALRAELEALDALFARTGRAMIAISSNFLSSYVVTQELLRRWGGQEAALGERRLFSGLTGLRSAEPGLALLKMAHDVRRSPRLEAFLRATPPREVAADLRLMAGLPGGAALNASLEAFLREYGHRAPREAELATPRWREDPTFLIEVLRTYLEAPYLPRPEELSREQSQLREETTEAMRRHFTTGLGVVFRRVLGMTQDNARQREDLRACVVDTLSMYRWLYLEVGRRMTRQRVLSSPDDVFFLVDAEVRAWLRGEGGQELALRVAIRRAAYEAFEATPDPPETFLLKDGHIMTTEAALDEAASRTLEGLPGSPGRVTGRARVIFDPNGAQSRLEPGEILVAPFTDVGWTPLFLAAAGVVMDKGGPLSHSCVVAREYGIPAVVNARRATALIRTGDLITLDGDRGVVYLPGGPPPAGVSTPGTSPTS
jgi:phosphohistidine swiveling domain-containing protein